ncbi:hypothetical protein PG993_007654 [Apiospora rasikravindrae]|uniref:DUF7918 domain-containing protein n=1 Tax=Apiospora rasikravindrae TaxID=990691 RepID=A0ABR1T0E1_9PEZI
MTIIDGVPGIEVTIWIGGRPAFEYGDPDHSHELNGPGTKVSSKYIESRSGEEFAIHVRVNPTYDHQQPVPHTLNLAAFIDGQWIRGELCRDGHIRDGPFQVYIKERITKTRSGTTVKQSFKFAGLATVDDTSSWRVENEREKVRDLGVIELRVIRVQELGSSSFKPSTETSGLVEVAEKSLKGRAISHGTQFGDNVRSPAGANILPRYRDVKRLPGDTGPHAIYRFTYRSREGLCQEAIITREQNEALSQAEPPRRGEAPNQAPPAAAAAANRHESLQKEMRRQAVQRLRSLGVEADSFKGHRERARAHANRGHRGQGGQQRRLKEELLKEEPLKKEEGSPSSGESKKRKVEEVDLTSD